MGKALIERWGDTTAYKISVQAAEEKHFRLVYLVPCVSASKACNEEQWRNEKLCNAQYSSRSFFYMFDSDFIKYKCR